MLSIYASLSSHYSLYERERESGSKHAGNYVFHSYIMNLYHIQCQSILKHYASLVTKHFQQLFPDSYRPYSSRACVSSVLTFGLRICSRFLYHI